MNNKLKKKLTRKTLKNLYACSRSTKKMSLKHKQETLIENFHKNKLKISS